MCFVGLWFLGIFMCCGEALDNQPLARSPSESLGCVHIPAGFKAEIVACEPLIESPVAFEWGADGRLWVVEMRDYPSTATNVFMTNRAEHGVDYGLRYSRLLNRTGGGSGRIVALEDTHGDGVYDKAVVFLDGLDYPNGICPWRNGVMVSAGGEIFYAESTDGTGKANVRKTILSGFNPGNPQHRVNGFDYGLDNWLYAANGDSGGRIRSYAGGQTTMMGGCDLRFRPDTGEFDLQAGTSQYGRHRDDWGNWFGNQNVAWLWHYCVPLPYL
jgi:glucose/arabinose dehydrogenase